MTTVYQTEKTSMQLWTPRSTCKCTDSSVVLHTRSRAVSQRPGQVPCPLGALGRGQSLTMRLAVGRGGIQEELPGFRSGLCWALGGPGPRASSWGPGLLGGWGVGVSCMLASRRLPGGFCGSWACPERGRMRQLRGGGQLKTPCPPFFLPQATELGPRWGL